MEAKVVQNFLVIKTTKRRFLYAPNIFKPFCI